jgi:hypothetical protein
VDITQTDADCSYQLSAGGQVFAASGGSAAIVVTADAGCPWSVSGQPSWVTLTSKSNGNGSSTVAYTVASNTGADRTASLTVAGVTFRIEQTGPTLPGAVAIGSLAQIASEGTWDTSFNYVNLGPAQAQTRTTFFDGNGGPLPLPFTFPQLPPASGPLLASMLDRSIDPNATLVMDSTGPANASALIGWGQLFSSGNLGGFSIFTNQALGWNAVVPLETRNAGSYILPFDNTGALTTGVAIANVAAQAATVPVTIRDDAGALIATASVALAARGQTSFMLNQQYPGTAAKRGTIEFDTPGAGSSGAGQISVLGLRANGPALTTLPVLANLGTGGGSITHSTYNGGFTSSYYLVNTGTSATSFTLSFFDEAGNSQQVPLLLPQSGTTLTTGALTRTLAAGALLEVVTQAQDALPLVQGSAQLTTTGAIGGFEVFRWNTFGQEASVPIETRAPNSFLLMYDDTVGLTTGVALANLANAAASIKANIYDDTGKLIQTATVNLAARGHSSFMLPDVYAPTANKRGLVEFLVPQGGKISAIGVRATSAGTLTTIPVLAR